MYDAVSRNHEYDADAAQIRCVARKTWSESRRFEQATSTAEKPNNMAGGSRTGRFLVNALKRMYF